MFEMNAANSPDMTRIKKGSRALNKVQNEKQNNMSSLTAPSIGDDSLLGYTKGSQWVNVNYMIHYICTDATAGAAVWKILSNASNTTAIGDRVPKIIGDYNIPNTGIVKLSIVNFTTIKSYTIIPSHGTATLNGSIIRWDIGDVDADVETISLEVQSILDGSDMLSSTHTCNVIPFGVVEDSTLLYNSDTISEFLVNKSVGRTKIEDDKIGSYSDAYLPTDIKYREFNRFQTTLTKYNTKISAANLEIGDIIIANGIDHKINSFKASQPNGDLSEISSFTSSYQQEYIRAMKPNVSKDGLRVIGLDPDSSNIARQFELKQPWLFDTLNIKSQTQCKLHENYMYYPVFNTSGTKFFYVNSDSEIIEHICISSFQIEDSIYKNKIVLEHEVYAGIYFIDDSTFLVSDDSVLYKYEITDHDDFVIELLQSHDFGDERIETFWVVDDMNFYTSSDKDDKYRKFSIENFDLDSIILLNESIRNTSSYSTPDIRRPIFVDQKQTFLMIIYSDSTNDRLRIYKNYFGSSKKVINETTPSLPILLPTIKLKSRYVYSKAVMQNDDESSFNGYLNPVAKMDYKNTAMSTTDGILKSSSKLVEGTECFIQTSDDAYSQLITLPEVTISQEDTGLLNINTIPTVTNIIFDGGREETFLFIRDGDRLLSFDNKGGIIKIYDTSSPYSLYDPTLVSESPEIAEFDASVSTNIALSDDEASIYVSNSNGTLLGTMSTTGDASTLTYTDVAMDIGASGIEFNNDGTLMFVSFGDNGTSIKTYELSTAYDVSTYDEISSDDVGAQYYTATLNSDGTKLAVMFINVLHVYKLTTAYDISTKFIIGIVSKTNSYYDSIYFNDGGIVLFDESAGIAEYYNFINDVYSSDISSIISDSIPDVCFVPNLDIIIIFGNESIKLIPNNMSLISKDDIVPGIDLEVLNIEVSYDDIETTLSTDAIKMSLRFHSDGIRFSELTGTLTRDIV